MEEEEEAEEEVSVEWREKISKKFLSGAGGCGDDATTNSTRESLHSWIKIESLYSLRKQKEKDNDVVWYLLSWDYYTPREGLC